MSVAVADMLSSFIDIKNRHSPTQVGVHVYLYHLFSENFGPEMNKMTHLFTLSEKELAILFLVNSEKFMTTNTC